MRFAELLTADEVQRVHEASLEILAHTGILVRSDRARHIFARAGCRVDQYTAVVRIPTRVVEAYRQAFVPEFTFRGRDPRFDRTIPRDGPVMVTASSAPDVLDPDTGRERRARSEDIGRIAFLVNELSGYDVFSISTLAEDAPPGHLSLYRFYPALKHCAKPVRGNTPSLEELRLVLELGAAVAGSPEAYHERPFITHHYCPVISPLTMDAETTDQVLHLVEKGLPVYGTIAPNGGMSAPMTLGGILALGNAEFLALAVLMQMLRPGTPLIYAVLSTVADMRDGSYTPGAIESGILQMGHTQMARFYGVPSGGYVGLTNAHCNDAQSGYETGMNTTAAVLAGADMLNMGGLIDSLMTFDFAKAFVDHEIALMLKRIRCGLALSEEDLALDVIAQTGHGGSFIASEHTIQHMRESPFPSRIATRDIRSLWEARGCPDVQRRALEEVRRILAQENPAVLPADLDGRIRRRFQDQVPPLAA